jgi:hypothetical protein
MDNDQLTNQGVDTTQNPIPQPIPETTDFSAQTQDFTYFDPSTAPQTPAPTAEYFTSDTFQNQPAAQDFVDPNLNAVPVDESVTYGQVTDPAFGVQPIDSSYDQAGIAAATANTFIEEKTGNKRLLYIAGGVVALLVIAASILVWLNTRSTNQANTAATQNTSVPQSQTSNKDQPKTEEKVDVTVTGGNDTPATKARVTSGTKPEADWFKKWFVSPVIDENGVCIVLETCGNDSDKDKDGISTVQEYQFGTDPQNNDTDGDTVADGDEVFVFYSDPKKADSDEDTFKDGEEIAFCFDPIKKSADNISLARQTAIGNNVSLKQTHEPTTKTLTTSGASQADINGKGFNTAKCAKPASDTESSTSKPEEKKTDVQGSTTTSN